MVEQVEAKKPAAFKKFKRKTKLETVVNEDNPFANSNQQTIKSVPQLSFVQKLNLLIEGDGSKAMTQKDVSNGVVVQFQTPKIIDWSEKTGRFALAETVLKTNELEFVAMRLRMNAMADADGCGGRSEMAKSSETGLGNNVIYFGQAKLNKSLGTSSEHKHQSGEHDHCSHDNDFGSCPEGCKKAA